MEKSAQAFRTISEVAQDLDLPQHVLRFWETRFVQIRPLKRGGGRRYYRPEDIDLLRAIRQLLYGEGYTIKGVQKILKEQGARGIAASYGGEGALLSLPVDAAMPLAMPLIMPLYDDGPDSFGDTPDVANQDALNFAANRGPSLAPVTSEKDFGIDPFPDPVVPAPAQTEGRLRPPSRRGPVPASEASEFLQEMLTELVECVRILDAARGG